MAKVKDYGAIADGSTQTFYGNKTLYAIWKPDVYTITYNSNGAAPTNVTFSQTFTSGQVPSATILTAWQSLVSKLTASYTSFTFSSKGCSISIFKNRNSNLVNCSCFAFILFNLSI